LLKRGDVFYGCVQGLSGLHHPHHHIVIKDIPPDSVAVVYITKNIPAVMNECYRDDIISSKIDDPISMIRINPDDLSVLNVESAINCNQVSIKEISFFESVKDYNHEGKINNVKKIPEIIKAAKSSNTLLAKIKNQL
jgi:hypothetical protein